MDITTPSVSAGSQISREDALLKTALSSTAIRELYDKATSIPSMNGSMDQWKVKFVEKTVYGHKAECGLISTTIFLQSDLSDQQALTFLVFELANAVHKEPFYEMEHLVEQGLIGRLAYAKEVERIEHGSVLLHREVIQKAIKEMNWSENLDIYRSFETDFEKFWESAKQTPHAYRYKKDWDKRCPIARQLELLQQKTETREARLLEAVFSNPANQTLYYKACDTRIEGIKGNWKIKFVDDLPDARRLQENFIDK